MQRPIPVEEAIAGMPLGEQRAIAKRGAELVAKVERTVAAMGGHLTMIATFPEQEPVVLVASQFAEKAARGAKGA
jgi:hypothetical protein